MRILVLLSDAFGAHGGIGKFNRDLLSALCSHSGVQTVVALPRHMNQPSQGFPDKLQYITKGLGGKVRYLIAVWRTIQQAQPFDLVICGHINLLPLARLAGHVLGSPVLLILHGIDAWQPTRSRLTNRLVLDVEAIASVSHLTLDRFRRWATPLKAKTFVLPNCVDLSSYGPGPKAPKLLQRYGLEGKTILMTLGRLVSAERAKGFDEVLEALPNLLSQQPELAYLIVGDGPDRLRLEQKARALNITEHVVFAGLVPESEKADHYRLADAYVMPSRGEGFGIVYLEALACGVPVAASRLDGSLEAVRYGKLGVLIDPTDPDNVRDGIRATLSSPRGTVPDGLDYYSFAQFEVRVHNLLNELLGQGGRNGG